MSVELRVYPNQLNKDDYEPLQCDAGITLHDYLTTNVSSYHERPAPLFSVLLNGILLPFDQWKITQFVAGDLVECMVEPKDPATAVMVVIAVASAAYAIHMANQPLPDTYNNTAPRGSTIYDVNTQGNKPRLMGTVPVLLGSHKVFADYLNLPRAIYVKNKKILYLMLSCGVGEMELLSENIFIGDTQISKFGDDVSYQVFPPGADVSGHEAHLNEYRSVEVGSSNGTSGLELKGTAYALDWVRSEGGDYYSWVIQGDTKELAFYKSTYSKGTLHNHNLLAWQAAYKRATGVPLMGVPLEFIDKNDNSMGIYRGVSEYNWGEHAVFEKLNSDLSVDTSWTGFGAKDIEFEARYRVFNVVTDNDLVGPFSAVPFGESTDKLIFDFRLNEGLTRLDSSGDTHSHSIKLEIQWRLNEAAPWQKKVQIYTAATRDQLAYTLDIVVPTGSRPDVRIRRLTASSDDILIKDKIEWVALRSSLKSAKSYPGITTIAFKITGTDELANTAENKVGIVPTRKLKKFNSAGQMTSFGPTRSISSALYAVATELGHKIDMDILWKLHKIWEPRGDYFDAVYDNTSTSWKVFQQILAVGFAEPTLDFGLIIPVRDQKQKPTALKNQYQMGGNILEGSWKMDGSFVDDSEHDGLEVECFSRNTWKSEIVLCKLPGQTGLNPEKVRAFGITGKTQAYRFGMRKLATKKHRRVRHKFSTELDALNSRYMSYDSLGVDMPGYSQTGHVDAAIKNDKGKIRELTLNRDLEWIDGKAHYIGIRRPNGTTSGPYRCCRGITLDSVVLDNDLDFVPVFKGDHEPPYFMFGMADEWCQPVLIKEIKPQGTTKVSVTAFEYSDKVYLYDDAVPVT